MPDYPHTPPPVPKMWRCGKCAKKGLPRYAFPRQICQECHSMVAYDHWTSVNPNDKNYFDPSAAPQSPSTGKSSDAKTGDKTAQEPKGKGKAKSKGKEKAKSMDEVMGQPADEVMGQPADEWVNVDQGHADELGESWEDVKMIDADQTPHG